MSGPALPCPRSCPWLVPSGGWARLPVAMDPGGSCGPWRGDSGEGSQCSSVLRRGSDRSCRNCPSGNSRNFIPDILRFFLGALSEFFTDRFPSPYLLPFFFPKGGNSVHGVHSPLRTSWCSESSRLQATRSNQGRTPLKKHCSFEQNRRKGHSSFEQDSAKYARRKRSIALHF